MFLYVNKQRNYHKLFVLKKKKLLKKIKSEQVSPNLGSGFTKKDLQYLWMNSVQQSQAGWNKAGFSLSGLHVFTGVHIHTRDL